jgi:hypothetical protein
MILRVVDAEVCGDYALRLTFNDGSRKSVNVLPLLEGVVFRPLLDPGHFARVKLDPVCGTVVWPNGADLAPEALHELDSLEDADGARAETTPHS